MIPHTIQSNLSALRRRERLILLGAGIACWLALVLALLVLCGFIDWAIDRERDTPWPVRYALFGLQVGVASIGGLILIVGPQLRRLRDDDLALFVEERIPTFRHRLISAVQLNRPGVDLGGMSLELVEVVTREAETRACAVRFAGLVDHSRLGRAAAVLLPIAMLAAAPFVLWPDVAEALLARQGLEDVDVPRSVYLDSVTRAIWPAGEAVKLIYRVTGPGVRDDLQGQVTVTPRGQPSDRFALEFIGRTPDGAAEFAAEVPPAAHDLAYSARLGDGRSRQPGRIEFVPRPIVTEQKAWVQLPAFCGLRPDGSPYEVPQGRGDVIGIKGSAARIAIEVQKPIVSAIVEVLAPADPETSSEAPVEVRKRVVTMAMAADRQGAEAAFDLRPDESAYRILLADEHGFENVPPPRRGLRLVPEESPQAFLLKDSFGIGADSDLEGIPVPIGGSIRIPYVAHGPYGLAGARLLYRAASEPESGNEEFKPKPWVALPLPEVLASAESGPFDPKRGVFLNTSFDQEVPFHAVASPAPDSLLGRTLGGGRSFLRTGGLVQRDDKGKTTPLNLKVGAKIEYCVEIFADKQDLGRQPDPNRDYSTEVHRPWSRSETRVTEIVTFEQFQAWGRAVADEESRLRKLDAQQRGVFGSSKE